MRKLASLYAVVCLSTRLFAQAEVPHHLTLQNAERIALQNNPRLKILQDEIRIRQADVISAAKRLNPVFSFDGEALTAIAKSEATFRINQEFELGGKRRLRVEAAEVDAEIGQLILENEKLKLVFQVRESYLRAALALKAVD